MTTDNGCIWEDCDQQAVYCHGHALELANVSHEDEAIKLRHTVNSLTDFLRYVAEDDSNPVVAQKARAILLLHGI